MNIKLSFPKKKKNFKRKHSEIDADFYWRIILYGVLCLVIAAGAFGYYLFSRTGAEADQAAADAAQAGAVKKERIDAALGHFTDRQKASDAALGPGTGLVDPSL